MFVKAIASAILACACMFTSLSSRALPVYSSGLNDRKEFCLKVEATAKTIVEDNVPVKVLSNLAEDKDIKSLSKTNQITLFDALWGAKQRGSFWWVYNFCMDRVES